MKIAFLASTLPLCFMAVAQKTVDVNANANNGVGISNYYTVNGTPFVNLKFVNLVEGTPYLTDQWLKGAALGRNGQRFGGSPLKIDLLNDELHYLDKDGKEMLASVEAKELWLEDTVKSVKYHLVSAKDLPQSGDKIHWYEELEKGKVRLLKASFKLLSETLPYGASTHEQRIHTKDRYYLEAANALLPVKNEKETAALLNDKKSELEAFLKTDEGRKGTNEERIRNLVRYYNSLFTK